MSSDNEKEAERSSESSIPPLLPDDACSVDSNGVCRMYKYNDYANVEQDQDLGEQIPTAVVPSSRGSGESSIRVQKFPVKLYAILAQKEFHDIITWMPHGRAWKVLKPSMFESLVMPLFFEYSNYHSFNRLVNAWSFRRVSSGPDRGAYYHELFLRGKPHLQKFMRRLPKTHKKLPMKKGDEPDFYQMDKTNPLPALDEAPIPGAAATSQALRRQQAGGMPGAPGQPIVTPPRGGLSGGMGGMAGGMPPSAMHGGMPPRAPLPTHSPHRFGGHPGGMYNESVGAFDEYENPRTLPHPGMMATPMRGMPPPHMHMRQRPDQRFMDQAEYFHFQQQQQMSHMQHLHQMRMLERKQQMMASPAMNQEEYNMMRLTASPQRY